MNPFVMAYAQSDFFGKLIMLGLVALSMICWVVLLRKIWLVRRIERLSRHVQAMVEQQKGSLLTIDAALFGQLGPFMYIFRSVQEKAIEILNKNRYFLAKTPAYLTAADMGALETHASASISLQLKNLEKHLFVLPTIVALAPFMGLLGTVWGILVTFSGFQAGGSAGSNAAILGGLSTALATTVMGLVIAIPALVAYNYIKNCLRHYATDMDAFLTTVLSQIELQYRNVE